MKKNKILTEIIIGGFAALIVGIVIPVKTSADRWYSYSSFSSQNDAGSALIVVLVLVALAAIGAGVVRVAGQSKDYEDCGAEPVEDFTERLAHEEKPAPAPAPVVVRVEKPREKKMVFCPYCGTAQDEDYKTCESCGAGRRK